MACVFHYRKGWRVFSTYTHELVGLFSNIRSRFSELDRAIVRFSDHPENYIPQKSV